MLVLLPSGNFFFQPSLPGSLRGAGRAGQSQAGPSTLTQEALATDALEGSTGLGAHSTWHPILGRPHGRPSTQQRLDTPSGSLARDPQAKMSTTHPAGHTLRTKALAAAEPRAAAKTKSQGGERSQLAFSDSKELGCLQAVPLCQGCPWRPRHQGLLRPLSPGVGEVRVAVLPNLFLLS